MLTILPPKGAGDNTLYEIKVIFRGTLLIYSQAFFKITPFQAQPTDLSIKVIFCQNTNKNLRA